MKTKRKNELLDPLASETVSAEMSKVLAELESTDNLLDAVESELVERKENFAQLNMRYRSQGHIHAAYELRLTALPYQQTKIDVFPYVESPKPSNSRFVSLASGLILGLMGFIILRDGSARGFGMLAFFAVLGVLAILAIRYNEQQRNKPAGYVEGDAVLLLRSIKLAISQAEDAEIDSESLHKEKYLGNMS